MPGTMRYVVCVLAVLSVLPCRAVEWWVHEKLVKGLSGGATIWNPRSIKAVNSQGDVAYNVRPTVDQWYDVYKNSENVSEWLGPVRTAYYFGINEAGQVGYGGWAKGWRNFKVFVDRTDWSSSVLDPEKSYDMSAGAVAEDGAPIWTSQLEGTRRQDLWYGHRRLTEGVSGEFFGSFKDINRNGDLLWSLNGDQTGWQRQLFLNDRNITVPVVGYGAAVGLNAYLNDRGDVAWKVVSWDPQVGIISHVYVNDVNVSRQLFGDTPGTHASPVAINNRGDVAWGATDKRKGPDYRSQDVFRNSENLSYEVFGDEPHDAGPIALNERGDILWHGGGGGGRLFRNYTEVSALPGRGGLIIDFAGMDEHGRVLWGDLVEVGAERTQRVWVNDVCLTMDLYGDEWEKYASTGIQIGPNGHVLWTSWEIGKPDTAVVWRSTPIPEPGGLAAVGTGLLAVYLARRHRHRV